MAPYEYSALQTERSTRLLKVLPGGEDEQLVLELTEVNLDDKPVYDAISYTWGKDQSHQPISINGRASLIRPNIHDFLLKLRWQGCTTRLWVDAISIRQDDATEKGYQVHMIGDIFSRARRVLVWVGGHASNSEALFRDPPGPQSPRESSLGEALKRILAWGHFMERPYWTRLWIVQEVCLAKEVIIHCGHSSSSWTQMMRFRWNGLLKARYGELVWDDIQLDQFSSEQRSRHAFLASGSSFKDKFLIIIKLDHLRRITHQTSWRKWSRRRLAHDLGFLVHSFDTQQCSDTRDRIFALLSLADGRMQRLQPDYTITSAELLVQVCLHRITAWSTGAFLSTIRITDRLLDNVQSRREALRLAARMYEKSRKSSQETRTSRLMLAAIRTAPWFDQVSDAWPSHIDPPFIYLIDHFKRLRENSYVVLHRTYLYHH